MSEASVPTMETQSAAAPSPVSAGALLRQARESAGLHVAALAVSMKVPVKKLEALEADRLDLLPDAVFVRALASSVCRALKIDPTPILERLPQTVVPRLDTEKRGINEPFQASGHASQLSMPAFLSKPVVWVVAILLAGAAVLFAFPEVQRLERSPEISSNVGNSVSLPLQAPVATEPTEVKPPPVEIPAPSVPAPVASGPAVEAEASPKSAAVAAPVRAVPSAAVAAIAPASLPAASASKQVPAALVQPSKMDTSAPTVNLAGAANGIVMFKATGTSWVEVTDVKGIVQLRKTLATGETAAASGVPPLSVVIGRADVTQVEVRGKPFTLVGIAKDNVARFEVK